MEGDSFWEHRRLELKIFIAIFVIYLLAALTMLIAYIVNCLFTCNKLTNETQVSCLAGWSSACQPIGEVLQLQASQTIYLMLIAIVATFILAFIYRRIRG